MDTIWCRGRLRVVIRAVHPIQKWQPIVLNYDEYIKADGTQPYFDSESMICLCVTNSILKYN